MDEAAATATADNLEPEILTPSSQINPTTPLQSPPSQSGVTLRVLYLFAGKPRRSDVAYYLKTLAPTDARFEIVEVDLARSSEHDLAEEANWFKHKSQIQAGSYDVVLASPPCNTWTRATFKAGGPKPLRNRDHPWGLPSLTPGSQDNLRCDQGSLLLMRALEACSLAQAAGTR